MASGATVATSAPAGAPGAAPTPARLVPMRGAVADELLSRLRALGDSRGGAGVRVILATLEEAGAPSTCLSGLLALADQQLRSRLQLDAQAERNGNWTWRPVRNQAAYYTKILQQLARDGAAYEWQLEPLLADARYACPLTAAGEDSGDQSADDSADDSADETPDGQRPLDEEGGDYIAQKSPRGLTDREPLYPAELAAAVRDRAELSQPPRAGTSPVDSSQDPAAALCRGPHHAQLWRAALEHLRPQMTGAQFDTWLRGSVLAEEPGGALVVCVHSSYVREMLETRYRSGLEAALRSYAPWRVPGAPALHIRVTPPPPLRPRSLPPAPPAEAAEAGQGDAAPSEAEPLASPRALVGSSAVAPPGARPATVGQALSLSPQSEGAQEARELLWAAIRRDFVSRARGLSPQQRVDLLRARLTGLDDGGLLTLTVPEPQLAEALRGRHRQRLAAAFAAVRNELGELGAVGEVLPALRGLQVVLDEASAPPLESERQAQAG